MVPGTQSVFILGGKPLAQRLEGKPLLVYIDGDAGWLSNGRFKALGPGFLDAKAIQSDGSPDPNRTELSKKICKDGALRFSRFGLANVILPRPGAMGTSGNYAHDIYTPRETQAIATALDDLRRIGVEEFIIYGFSGGAQAATMAAADRDDVDLIVSAGGMLSRKHHPKHEFQNDPLQIADRMPPMLIVHSKNDKQASYKGARAFHEKAVSSGGVSQFVSVDGSHFETIFDANMELSEYLKTKEGN